MVLNIIMIIFMIVFIVTLIPLVGSIVLICNEIYHEQFGEYIMKPKKKEK